jgi:hypothetical protein
MNECCKIFSGDQPCHVELRILIILDRVNSGMARKKKKNNGERLVDR